MRGYLPLIRNDSITHMHGLAFSVKEGLPFAWDLFREKSADSFLYFRLALLHLASYFFFFIDHLLLLCARFLILFRLTKMRFSRSTHLLMFLSFETLTSILKTGPPVLVELIDLVNSFIIFLFQTTLIRWLTFQHASQTMILTALLF